MYDFTFTYEDGHEIACHNVTTVKYESAQGFVTLSSDEIEKHAFNLDAEMYLYGPKNVYSVSPKILRAVSVVKS